MLPAFENDQSTPLYKSEIFNFGHGYNGKL